jgi:hypothetical protein
LIRRVRKKITPVSSSKLDLRKKAGSSSNPFRVSMLQMITRFLESEASLAFNRNPRKARCREFMLTLVRKGGLWSSTDLLSQIRFFANKSVEQGRCLGNYAQQSFFLEVSCSYYPCVSRTELVQSCWLSHCLWLTGGGPDSCIFKV